MLRPLISPPPRARSGATSMTIRRQMISLIAVPTLVIYVVILGFGMFYSYYEAKEAQQRFMIQLADSYASRLDAHLREVAQIAETTAGFVQTLDLSSSSFHDEKIY